MPAPEVLFLFEDSYAAADWHESMMHPRSDVLSPDRSSCSITTTVPYAQYKAAVRFILGYQWVDESKALRRSTPVFHPVYPWLYASAITSTTFKGPNNANRFTPPYDFAVYAGGYTHVEIEVEFRERTYQLWQDWDVDYEYERWFEPIRKPYTELAQIDGGQLKAVAPSIPDINAQPYLAAPHILARLPKVKIELHWYQVPTDFVEDADGFSTKFLAAEKTVNDATFLGWPAGTLLLEDIDNPKKPSPVATDLAEGLRFTYDVTFNCVGYNPDRGDTSVDKYGHNLLPAVYATGASGSRLFAFVYYTDDGTVTGKPLFPSYSFPKLFTHYSLT